MKTIVNTTFEVNTAVARCDLILVMSVYDFGQDLNFQLRIRRYHMHLKYKLPSGQLCR